MSIPTEVLIAEARDKAKGYAHNDQSKAIQAVALAITAHASAMLEIAEALKGKA